MKPYCRVICLPGSNNSAAQIDTVTLELKLGLYISLAINNVMAFFLGVEERWNQAITHTFVSGVFGIFLFSDGKC